MGPPGWIVFQNGSKIWVADKDAYHVKTPGRWEANNAMIEQISRHAQQAREAHEAAVAAASQMPDLNAHPFCIRGKFYSTCPKCKGSNFTFNQKSPHCMACSDTGRKETLCKVCFPDNGGGDNDEKTA